QQRAPQNAPEGRVGQLRQRQPQGRDDHDALPATGSTGTRAASPRSDSSRAQKASSSASPRGRATTCSPTGRPLRVKPAGIEIAGVPVSVMAKVSTSQEM